MSTQEKIEKMLKKAEVILAAGGEKRVAKQHESGKMTARERIAALLDEGSFVELDRFVRHRCYNFGQEKKELPGEGVQDRGQIAALTVAGENVGDAGQTIDIRDPLAEKIQLLVAGSSAEQRVNALLSLEEIFTRDLPQNTQFVAEITHAWHQISTLGARQAIAAALQA